MKVVGLLSGGKDSCFNLVHCVANGHDIVALASLGPPIGRGEESSIFGMFKPCHDDFRRDGFVYVPNCRPGRY